MAIQYSPVGIVDLSDNTIAPGAFYDENYGVK